MNPKHGARATILVTTTTTTTTRFWLCRRRRRRGLLLLLQSLFGCGVLLGMIRCSMVRPASALVLLRPQQQQAAALGMVAARMRSHSSWTNHSRIRRTRRRPSFFDPCSSSFRDTTGILTLSSHASSPSADNDANNNSSNSNEHVRQAKHRQLMEASTLSLAPMMEYTDRHFRHLVRLISKRTLLYTEMVAANAIARERQDRIDEVMQEQQPLQEVAPGAAGAGSSASSSSSLAQQQQDYSDHYLHRFLAQGRVAPLEGASVLQLGGSDPEQLYQAARCVTELSQRRLSDGDSICYYDYTALNLNCGCPSPKVAGKGCFGAALMEEPKLVAELTQAMHEGCHGRLPITVKCRIGTDSSLPNPDNYDDDRPDEDEYRRLCQFIETVASNNIVTDFSVHARIAVLQKKFSPADNRKIPKLKYDVVQRLVQDYPDLTFTLNGGVDSIFQAQKELEAAPGLKGVMIGRAFAADPWSFACADELLYKDTSSSEKRNRLQILEAYGRHADAEEEMGDPTKIRRFIVKAVMPLFTGEPNGKRYRIALDAIAGLPKKLHSQGKSLAGQPPLSELIMNAAMEHLSQETLLRTPAESYERILFEEAKRSGRSNAGRSTSINEWQEQRRTEESSENDSSGADWQDGQVVAG